MDASALNAAAVQAATEAMLAAGFGHWTEEVDEDDIDGDGDGGHGHPHPHPHAHPFHLAAQHTATAASSLSALPTSTFFAALRVGEGVDALDLIGYPQWRHAIILDSRHEEQEFFIRWAGWDQKWDGQSSTQSQKARHRITWTQIHTSSHRLVFLVLLCRMGPLPTSRTCPHESGR